MGNFNRIIIQGRLTKDPEIKYTPQGIQLANLNVAVNRNFSKDKQKKDVDFFNITAWKGLAEKCGLWSAKGSEVLVEGEMQNQKYEKDGKKHDLWKINANNIQFFGGNKNNQQTEQAEPNNSRSIDMNKQAPDEFDVENDMPF